MLVCWNYIPENRVNFQEIHSRLNEILSDQSKELPPTWFSYDASSSSAVSHFHLLVKDHWFSFLFCRLEPFWIVSSVILNHRRRCPAKVPNRVNVVHQHQVAFHQWPKVLHRRILINVFHPIDYVWLMTRRAMISLLMMKTITATSMSVLCNEMKVYCSLVSKVLDSLFLVHLVFFLIHLSVVT